MWILPPKGAIELPHLCIKFHFLCCGLNPAVKTRMIMMINSIILIKWRRINTPAMLPHVIINNSINSCYSEEEWQQ